MDANGGSATFTRAMGNPNDQRFYFLIQDNDMLMVYSCGTALSWHFEGVLVMSRFGELETYQLAQIE